MRSAQAIFTNLILLDWFIPVLDGAEFLKTRRLPQNLKDIPVILISAYRHQRGRVDRDRTVSRDVRRSPLRVRADGPTPARMGPHSVVVIRDRRCNAKRDFCRHRGAGGASRNECASRAIHSAAKQHRGRARRDFHALRAAYSPDERQLSLINLLAREAADYLQRVQTEEDWRDRSEQLASFNAALRDADRGKDEFLARPYLASQGARASMEIIRGAIESTQSFIVERGVTLETSISSEQILLDADPARLEQVFREPSDQCRKVHRQRRPNQA